MDYADLIPIPHEVGSGSVSRVGERARRLGGSHALLVTDAGVTAAGHADRARASLEQAGLRVLCYDAVHESPTTHDVAACAAAADGVDIIIALGGGSTMDTAKGTNFVLTSGGSMEQYRGDGKATAPMLPFIAIPTTTGTGSECQRYAIIADPDTHMKMACGDGRAKAAAVIFDPELAATQPHTVAAITGIDALTHAIESAVTKVATETSRQFSAAAFDCLAEALPVVLAQQADPAVWERMQIGAALAGAAIEASMLGAAHATANPLTARYGTIHGQAVGAMLPAVIAFNCKEPAIRDDYSILRASLTSHGGDVAGFVTEMVQQAGLETRLEALGVREADIPALAEQAAGQWTGQFNPRPVTTADFEEIYASVF